MNKSSKFTKIVMQKGNVLKVWNLRMSHISQRIHQEIVFLSNDGRGSEKKAATQK